MAKILKNTTGSPVFIKFLGLQIPANFQLTIEPEDYLILSSSDAVTELTTLINAGTIIVNDGLQDLSASRGIEYIQYPDDARKIRFRSPGFILQSINLEDAVYEAATTADDALNAPRYTITLQHKAQISNGTFFGYTELMPGNTTPIILPIESRLEEVTFSNSAINADFALEFRINTTTGTPFYTQSFTNTQTSVISGLTQIFNSGDAIYIKYVDNGDNASDAVLVLYMRAVI